MTLERFERNPYERRDAGASSHAIENRKERRTHLLLLNYLDDQTKGWAPTPFRVL